MSPTDGVLRIGTRASALARVQSGAIAQQLSVVLDRDVELVEVSTQGDRSNEPLASIGGAGVFVSALRDALLLGEIDVAVHSLKDLPTSAVPGIALAAVPNREDPRDVLISASGRPLAALPPGTRIGTGSPRRAAMLAGRGFVVVDIRGNVDTRLARVGHDLDAVVLAAAGLRRLGRIDEVTEFLSPEDMLPAPGQGALAVEVRATGPSGSELARRIRAALEDTATRLAVAAERSVLSTLEAGCSAPIGALATWQAPGILSLVAALGMSGRTGGAWQGVSRVTRAAVIDTPRAAAGLGASVAAALAAAAGLDLDLADGAADLVLVPAVAGSATDTGGPMAPTARTATPHHVTPATQPPEAQPPVAPPPGRLPAPGHRPPETGQP